MRTSLRIVILAAAFFTASIGCATSQDEVVGSTTDISSADTAQQADIPGLDYNRPCKLGDTPSFCDDSNACTDDKCSLILNGNAGYCQHLPTQVAGLSCDDSNACTVGDACKGSVCVSGAQKVCNNANPCTDGICDPATGACSFKNNTNPCDDGNVCTENDVCSFGKCLGGAQKQCTDNNACTLDTCEKIAGCVFPKITDGKCEDGDPCTTEKCEDGECVKKPLVCEDGNPCTNDYCDATAGGCISTDAPAGSPCDDKNPCTTADACSGGKCTSGQALNCNDNNACTNDTCDKVSGQCVHKPSGLTTCDDNNACTQDDTCGFSIEKNGWDCMGKPLDCNDGNPCTSDQCDPNVGCTHLTNNGVCNDYNPCTTNDVCQGGVCAGKAINCNDGNVCTKDYCDPQIGCISQYVEGIPCDDGNVCTKDDKCAIGKCMGGVYINCDDGNDCTNDMCNPNIGCVFQKVSNSAACTDGNLCTVGEKCQDGKCVGGTTPNCDDGNPCTKDYCDPKTGKCANDTLPNYTVCDDGNKCTTGDWCYKGQCFGPVMNFCNDKIDCTVDTCDPLTGKCHNTPIPDCSP